MKKFTGILMLALLALCFACSHNNSSAAVRKEKVVVVEYTTFKNRPVEMVLDPNDNTMELRIRFGRGDNFIFNDDNLDFLKDEVLRLTSGEIIKVGKSGYTFEFLGGKPIWAPYQGMYLDYHYSCLHFAQKVVIANKTITAQGDEGGGYDGYRLWKPQYNPYK